MGRVALGVIVGVALAFLFLPLISVFISMPLPQLIHDLNTPVAYTALALSLRTSVIALSLMVILGTPTAYWIARGNFPGRQVLRAAVQMPVVSPPAVAGVGLLLVFGQLGLLGHTLTVLHISFAFNAAAVVMAQLFIGAPFYLSSAIQAFENLDQRLLEASRTLGASSASTFFRVIVPLASPGLVTGFALGWGRALGEFGATMMFAGNLPGKTQTLPLAIYTAMQSNLQVAVAMSALLLVVSFALLVVVMALGRSKTGSRREEVRMHAVSDGAKTPA